jgi:G protein beta subunit-like protein
VLTRLKAPAGDVPIRSVSLASDGSCLVAGNNKV